MSWPQKLDFKRFPFLNYDGKKSFGLLIHGSQKKGSKASAALSNLKKKGIKGYSKKQKR